MIRKTPSWKRRSPLPAHPAHGAAAIVGMIPIAPTVFWCPMAYAIMDGLAVATASTPIFLPTLSVACFGIGEDAAPVGASPISSP